MRQAKIIYCCADCVNYSMKKHKCVAGAKDEGKAQDHFYADCPLDDFGNSVADELRLIREDFSKVQNDLETLKSDLEKCVAEQKKTHQTYFTAELMILRINKILEYWEVI